MKTDLEIQQQLDHKESLVKDAEYFEEVSHEFVQYVLDSVKDYRHIPEVEAAVQKWRDAFRDCFVTNGDAGIPEAALRALYAEVRKQKPLTGAL